MAVELTQRLVTALLERTTAPDGAPFRHGGVAPPDVAAWLAIALHGSGLEAAVRDQALAQLARQQREDGSVPVRPEFPHAFWPTYPALLAWGGEPRYHGNRERAVGFLLATTGIHFPRAPDDPSGHDTSIRGWPWTAMAHSFAESTALALLALERAGRGGHPRAREGRDLLHNRQLPTGGWNFGNLSTFGRVLHPMPESTGLALAALAGHTPREAVAHSIAHLQERLPTVHSALSLGWGIIGLSAWDLRPEDSEQRIAACLARERPGGLLESRQLALLLAALHPAGVLTPTHGEDHA